MSEYPTIIEVEKANHTEISYLYRYLRKPQNSEEIRVMVCVIKRFHEFEDSNYISNELSKEIGNE